MLYLLYYYILYLLYYYIILYLLYYYIILYYIYYIIILYYIIFIVLLYYNNMIILKCMVVNKLNLILNCIQKQNWIDRKSQEDLLNLKCIFSTRMKCKYDNFAC